MSVLVSTAYLPPISYMALLVQKHSAIIEFEENFEKQSYRNRCVILGANGIQKLTVPVIHTGGKTKIKDLKISYAEDWPTNHWRSLVSAYKGRPFFDILGQDLHEALTTRPTYLVDLNRRFLNIILDWLQTDIHVSQTEAFIPPTNLANDFRYKIHPKSSSIITSAPPYFQHFNQHSPFVSDLSVIDLIFSEGRASWDYLNELKLYG